MRDPFAPGRAALRLAFVCAVAWAIANERADATTALPASSAVRAYDVAVEVAWGERPAAFARLRLKPGETRSVEIPGLTESAYFEVTLDPKTSARVAVARVSAGRIDPGGARIRLATVATAARLGERVRVQDFDSERGVVSAMVLAEEARENAP